MKALLIFAVVACGVFVASLSFIRPSKGTFLERFVINLGLDLQGGIDIVLEVDFDKYFRDRAESLSKEIRAALRKERIFYRAVEPIGKGVRVELKNAEDYAKLNSVLRDAFDDTLVSESDDSAGPVVVSYGAREMRKLHAAVIGQSLEIIRNRIDEKGNKEISLVAMSGGRISLQVPGEDDPSKIRDVLNTTAKLTFRLLDPTMPFVRSGSQYDVPYGSKVLHPYVKGGRGGRGGRDGAPGESQDAGSNKEGDFLYVVKNETIIDGSMLVQARVNIYEGKPSVSFTLNKDGARSFAEVTLANSGSYLGIILDDKVLSAPVINEGILGGSGVISGTFSIEEASNLALLLRAGALPAPIKIVEERIVGAYLGRDSVRSGKMAVSVAVLLVVVYMVLRYRVLGAIAGIGVAVNLALLLALLAVLGSTLTLPGIAGIVLTVGMCVDANVLIFERIRELLSEGKAKASTVLNRAFEGSMSAIVDSNITTVLAGLCMYFVGSGPVKGFAITLIVGVICSMFSSVVLTKFLVLQYFSKRNFK